MLELHRKAAAWYKEHGLVNDALRHALAAGEAVWAARLLEQHVEEVLRRGEGETLRRWLAALPQEVVFGPLWAGITYDYVMPSAPYWTGAILLGLTWLELARVGPATQV